MSDDLKGKRDALGRMLPGHSANPSGVSRERAEFMKRLTIEDAEEIYSAFMQLVRAGNTAAVIRANEYLLGRPKDSLEVTAVHPAATTSDLSKLTVEELDALEDLLRRSSVLVAEPSN